MKHESEDTTVDESVEAIAEQEEQGEAEAEVIADTRDERLGDHRPRAKKFVDFLKSGKGITLIIFLVIVAAVFAVPMTRYALLGAFIKKQTIVTVVDDTTGKPVSEALVHFGRVDAKTDSKGVAKLDDMAVGDHPLSAEKKYYATTTTSYLVPITGEATTTIKLKATGRVATVTVKNAISGKELPGANVKIGDTVASTGDNGVASVALAVKDSDQTGEVALDGYAVAAIAVNTKDMSPSIDAQLVPNGKVYFLSNRTGSYNVMSSTLDGKDQQVLVKGTGKELSYELQLMASPNRTYLAYLARRDNDSAPSVYVIDTASGTTTKLDGSSNANVIGWIGNTFYFGLYNYSGAAADNRTQLVAYAADSKQRTVVDGSHLDGDQYTYAEQGISTRYQLVGGRIYYAKCWAYSAYYTGSKDRKASFMAVVDGKAVSLKDVSQNGDAYCDTVANKPNAIYYKVTYSSDSHSDSYRYQPGKAVEPVQVNDGELYNNVYTYLAAPSGTKTFWTETRDGKQVSFIGDANGQNEAQVSAADYTAFGWLGDDYVLYNKSGSELYVAAAGAQLDGAHKVADYFSQQRGPGY